MIPGLSTAKLIGIGVAALCLLFLVAERSRWMHRTHGAEAQVAEACTATRLAANRPKLDCKQMPQQIQFLGDALKDVKAKTEAAKVEDAAHARDVESRQNTISQETSHDYQAELQRVRADYAERLRRNAARGADQGRGGKPPVSGAAPGAGRPDAATAQGGLPPEDALTATEQAIQLKALQDWACKQGLFIAQCPVPTH